MTLFQFLRDRYRLTGEIPPAGNNMVGVVNVSITPEWWVRTYGPSMSQIKDPQQFIRAVQNAPADDVILVNEWGPWVQVNDRDDLIAALIAAFPPQ